MDSRGRWPPGGSPGIAGALLAWVTRGRIGRWPLALVCFVLGFAFTALQDVGDWVTYSDHSLAQLGVYVGKGIGFDVVYAAGCFGFAMLFGPALMRSMQRFTTRIQVTWLPPAAGVTGAAVARGLRCGRSGGLERGASSIGVDACLADHLPAQAPRTATGASAVREGRHPTCWTRAGRRLRSHSAPVTSSQSAAFGRAQHYVAATVHRERGAGAIERTILAASTSFVGKLTDFGGRNLVAALQAPVGGQRIGLRSDQPDRLRDPRAARPAGIRVGARTIDWLAHQQDRDGGFNFGTRGGQSDVDDTGAVLEALAGTNEQRDDQRAPYGSSVSSRTATAGFGMQPGAAFKRTIDRLCVVWAWSPPCVFPWQVHRHGAPSPLAYLRSLIQPDGAVDYARGNAQTPVWVTAEAQMALSGSTL